MTGNQRWRSRRDHYRPPAEPIRTADYEVVEIAGDVPAKAFVLAHHYSGSYPAARFRFGLYHHGELVGVAVFSHPCNDKALTSVFPGDPRSSVELGRFVLLDSVPGNGESWFLARAFEQLGKAGIAGVVSFSDPVPRRNGAGQVVFPGHIGTIYQAHNARYLGRGTARTLHLLPDGSVLSARTMQKIRRRERGWEYGVGQLTQYGAPPPEGELAPWLREWAGRLTHTLRHPGNHKYAWALQRREAALVSYPYPKRRDDGETRPLSPVQEDLLLAPA